MKSDYARMCRNGKCGSTPSQVSKEDERGGGEGRGIVNNKRGKMSKRSWWSRVAESRFPHLVRTGPEKMGLHPVLLFSLSSTHMAKYVGTAPLHSTSLSYKATGVCKNKAVFLLPALYYNGICIQLCNYSVGHVHVSAPDMGVCSHRRGKANEVGGGVEAAQIKAVCVK